LEQASAPSSHSGAAVLTGGFWFKHPPGDCNATGTVNLPEYADLDASLLGPGSGLSIGCKCLDFDSDNDVDLKNYSMFQVMFTGT
jgi:hypothetical protein